MGEAVFYFNELLCDIRICEKSSSKEKIIELMLFSLFLLTRPQLYKANSIFREIKRQLHSTKSKRRSLFYCNLEKYGWKTAVNSCLVWLVCLRWSCAASVAQLIMFNRKWRFIVKVSVVWMKAWCHVIHIFVVIIRRNISLKLGV